MYDIHGLMYLHVKKKKTLYNIIYLYQCYNRKKIACNLRTEQPDNQVTINIVLLGCHEEQLK